MIQRRWGVRETLCGKVRGVREMGETVTKSVSSL